MSTVKQGRLEAASLAMKKSLEKPRLQYRLRLLRQQQQAATEQLSEARRRLNVIRPQLQRYWMKVRRFGGGVKVVQR